MNSAVVDSLSEALSQLEQQSDSQVLKLLGNAEGDLQQLESRLNLEVTQITDELLLKFLPNPEDLVSMYREAEQLDKTLFSMEQELGSFLDGLHSVSESIHQLQYRSHEINSQLKDKRNILDGLTTYVESVIIDPALIRAIVEPTIYSLATIPRLNDLSSKLFALGRRSPGDGEQTVVLEKLRLRAVLKCKELLCGTFEDLKAARPEQTATVRAEIVKLQPFLVFLHQHDEPAYDEVLAYYIPIASKVVSASLKAFLATHPKPGIAGIFEALAAPLPAAGTATTGSGVSLGGREILIGETRAAVKSGGEVPDRSLPWYEDHLFRFQLTLGNAATHEYLFLCNFFPANHTEIFSQIFHRVCVSSQDELTKDINHSCDLVSLLLCVHGLDAVRDVLSGRHIPTLRTFHERLLNVTVWPRIRSLFEQHIVSLKQANIKALQQGSQSLQPHFVARRYAELLSSALVLKKSTWTEATGFPACMRELVSAFDAMLGVLAKKTGSAQDEAVFLLNNWDFIVTILNTTSAAAEAELLLGKYDEKIKTATASFVEGQLSLRFSQLLTFVTDAEMKSEGGVVQAKDSTVATVNAWFKNNWKFEVEKIKNYVNTNFSNLTNALEILKNILTQLLLYYTRFQKLLAKKYGSTLPPNLAKDQVPTQDLMAEIKALSSF